jgi:hypothetical protein
MIDLIARIQPVLDDLIQRGAEVGLQVAAYLDGQLILDLWAGIADEETGRPVAAATLFTAFSATKGLVATAIHLLADCGRLAYDTPVADYRPAFAALGPWSALEVDRRQADGTIHAVGIGHVRPELRRRHRQLDDDLGANRPGQAAYSSACLSVDGRPDHRLTHSRPGDSGTQYD